MKKERKIGILTFHNSYNCGSMLQAYALQTYLKHIEVESEIIDFSNKGQKYLYSVFSKDGNFKSFVKNIILFFHQKRIKSNYESYELFKIKNFLLSKNSYEQMEDLDEGGYDCIIAGSDQIWNVTIQDGDDAYFLPWVEKTKKVAYAPSFGAKNLLKYSKSPDKYKKWLQCFDALSIREENGKKWLKDLTGKDVPVVLDPTLLLTKEDYEGIIDKSFITPEKYIFYYSPGYNFAINKLVKQISTKYKLPVIAFNAKNYFLKGMNFSRFQLPQIENPSVYLQLIKNATMVITTSFHGTVFSSIFGKNFWTIKNGGMYKEDDRVVSLMRKLDLQDRLIPIEFDENLDYLQAPNYNKYNIQLKREQAFSVRYLSSALGLDNEKRE